MSDLVSARRRLVALIQPLAGKERKTIERLKGEAEQINRSDFLWHYMLQSFATLGNLRGWDGLIGNPENYQKVAYEALLELPPDRRLSMLKDTLRKAKVRMPDKKARWLAENLKRIQEMGGPQAAKEALLSEPGREGKIKFLKSFMGIGNKYARNIMMDVYHPEFRDSIAIDARIESVTKVLGLKFKSYEEHEQFYMDVAHTAGLTGWELDRLLFTFFDEVTGRLSGVLDSS